MTSEIIGGFSEEQVERLTGISKAQLRRWNANEFIFPEFFSDENARNFRRIYSFKDLLKLRVLNQLRNVHRVPMLELYRVAKELGHLGHDKWTSQTLWVHNRRVVFLEPEANKRREISSKQFVAEIPLAVVTADAKKDIMRLNVRNSDRVGKIEKRRNLHSSEPVFSGTRIPVNAIVDYINNGYKDAEILRKFPDLVPADIDTARGRVTKAA